MATSGTTTFTLDIATIIEEAYERIGLELQSGYQLTTAGRSLNLLMTEWVNRGINLWTVDQTTTTIVADDQTVTMGASVVDIIDAVVRDSNSLDTPMEHISMSAYLGYPDKSVTGTPTQYAVERNTSAHTVYLYPAASTSYTLVSWTVSYMEDVGAYSNNPDVPKRFLPALVSGLAFRLAGKNPAKYELDAQGRPYVVAGVTMADRQDLERLYEKDFAQAKEEDHERASLYLVPNVRH